jgi:hypothetical protein
MLVKDLQADYYKLQDDTKQGMYLKMPSVLAQHESLTDADYRVLSVLNSFFNQLGETFVSNFTLAKSTNRSERSVIRSLNNLKKQGYIDVEYIRKGKEIIKRFIRPTELLSGINEMTKMSRGSDKRRIDSGDKSGVENINKDINKNKEYIGVPFERFWEAYDKKVGEKNKVKKKWGALTLETQNKILAHIPKYKLAQPNKQYRKNPETYLNNKSWEDEIIASSTNLPASMTMQEVRELGVSQSILNSKYQFNQASGKFYLK